MLNNKTLETNRQIKNRICLRQLCLIKNGLIHFKMVPIQFIIHLLKRGKEKKRIK